MNGSRCPDFPASFHKGDLHTCASLGQVLGGRRGQGRVLASTELRLEGQTVHIRGGIEFDHDLVNATKEIQGSMWSELSCDVREGPIPRFKIKKLR